MTERHRYVLAARQLRYPPHTLCVAERMLRTGVGIRTA